MLTFKEFVTELAREEVILSPVELSEMVARFGTNVFQMGHVEADGAMRIPVDCILEAVGSLESQVLTEAAEIINNDHIVSLLRSGDTLVERVVEAREKKLRQLVRAFQDEPDKEASHLHWKQIEKEVFGVEYRD